MSAPNGWLAFAFEIEQKHGHCCGDTLNISAADLAIELERVAPSLPSPTSGYNNCDRRVGNSYCNQPKGHAGKCAVIIPAPSLPSQAKAGPRWICECGHSNRPANFRCSKCKVYKPDTRCLNCERGISQHWGSNLRCQWPTPERVSYFEPYPFPNAISPQQRPRIICLCGSTRFIDTWIGEYQRLSDQGNIVLAVASMPPRPNLQKENPELKLKLDDLHLRKIDLADEVFVLNVGGYIGESTKRKIAYAGEIGKLTTYLEPICSCPPHCLCSDCSCHFTKIPVPAPAALSVDECARELREIDERLSEMLLHKSCDLCRSSIDSLCKKLDAAKFHFAGAVGQPPSSPDSLFTACPLGCGGADELIHHKCTKSERPSQPSESPAVPECAHCNHSVGQFVRHCHQCGASLCDHVCEEWHLEKDCNGPKQSPAAKVWCCENGFFGEKHECRKSPPPEEEVPFSIPLRPSRGIDPTIIFDAKDEISIYINCPSNKPRTIKIRDYIISAVNSHEELKRQVAMLIETLAVSPVTCYMCETEGIPILHNGKWVHAHGDIGLRDCLSPALRAESLLSLNAELREALKEITSAYMQPPSAGPGPMARALQRADAVLLKAEKAVRP